MLGSVIHIFNQRCGTLGLEAWNAAGGHLRGPRQTEGRAPLGAGKPHRSGVSTPGLQIPCKRGNTLAAPHPEINMVILKLICKRKGPKTAGTVLKRDEVGELTCLDFKAYYKGTAARHGVDVDGWMALGAQRYAPHLPPTDFRKARL